MDKNIVLYTTGCSKCAILEKKLDLAGVPYTTNTDEEEMQALGMTSAPALMVDGRLMEFGEAVHWVNANINTFKKE